MVLKVNSTTVGLILSFSGLFYSPIYPIFSYISRFRDACNSRISGATDQQILFLENQEDPVALMEATRLKTTYAEAAEPLVSLAFQDAFSCYMVTPFQSITSSSIFSSVYSWFSKKLYYTQVIPAVIKGILSGAVIFAMVEAMSNKLYPQWVKNNYYTKTVASRLCTRFAIGCGMCLIGTQLSQDESLPL